jgi:hypothetical protein
MLREDTFVRQLENIKNTYFRQTLLIDIFQGRVHFNIIFF